MTAPQQGVTVSVIIPFHAGGETLRRSLLSVESQQFEETVETIVVVDGAAEDLRTIEDDFPRVRFVQQPNAGPGPARNRGIDVAVGDFIAFLDSDDFWHPTKLAVQVAAMRSNDAAWSQHSYDVVDPSGSKIRTVDTGSYSGDVLRATLLSFRVQTSMVMVRRACLVDGDLRFGADRVGEDGYLYTQLARRYPLLAVHQVLGSFTWHGANAGGRADVQLWSRARTWKQSRSLLRTTLPFVGQLAYAWCAMAARLLRYPVDVPPRGRHQLPARVAYAPSYAAFQILAGRQSS